MPSVAGIWDNVVRMIGGVAKVIVDTRKCLPFYTDVRHPMTIVDNGRTVTVLDVAESEKIICINGDPIQVYLFSTELSDRMFDKQFWDLLGYYQTIHNLHWSHDHIGINLASSMASGGDDIDCAVVDISTTLIHELSHWAGGAHDGDDIGPNDWDQVIVRELDFVLDDVDVIDLAHESKRPDISSNRHRND